MQVWDFEKIDSAEVVDESGVCEMEPMNELKVGTDVQLKMITKSVDPEDQTIWFGQVVYLHAHSRISCNVLICLRYLSVFSLMILYEYVLCRFQDANGGIWKLDLSFSFTSLAPEKLFSYHSGRITGCEASPLNSLVASSGVDGWLHYYARFLVCY